MAYTWSESAGRFVDERGRFVSDAAVRRVVNDIADGASDRLAVLSRSMLAGDLSLAEWQAGAMRIVKSSHVASVTIAHGGAARMDFSRYGSVGNEIKAQYQYLAQFAAQIASGQQPLNGTVASRAAMYGQNARVVFEKAYGRDQAARGFQSCRNRLQPAEHCSQCVEQSGRGWVPVGSLVPIGQRTCRSNCRCRIEYRREPVEVAA